ncbi:N-acetylmuramoyl-L-alanine amidase [Paraflavitalea speifideaquila]|uniref:N-acetylmuramoyl-L-alanine amidase n=1 Tax=Paraflavitalea speifideaquila TaxID=3076558 RepID=UPI0028EAAE25|nr:N-acetylmuramoyl-L-alanine amidase [Paraflavitalea speifideiaquila]
MLPFNTIAWHAGVSEWNGLTNLNNYSIGIELDNAGWLTHNNYRFLSWQEQEYPFAEIYHHQTYAPGQMEYWHAYTEAQINMALSVTRLLVEQFDIEAILGHEEVAPDRKKIQVRHFPCKHFANYLFNRAVHFLATGHSHISLDRH